MKIVVIGLGYVGLANAIFFSHRHDVIGYDTDHAKLEKIAKKICPIEDQSIAVYFKQSKLNIQTVSNPIAAYACADAVIIATPTDYDQTAHRLDTSSVSQTISDVLAVNRTCAIIIRSTLPIGTVDELTKTFDYENITFVPEFLREGLALTDTMTPTRLVIGTKTTAGKQIAELFASSFERDVPLIFATPIEAEAIKLFSNAYLAMRIAFFNELDNMAIDKRLDVKTIITALGLDPRIGKTYNNPSFGFSGYCLPKDTQQLDSDFGSVPHELTQAIGKSNQQRIDFIVDDILSKHPQTIGVYRLTMKKESNNLRHAIIHEVIKRLQERGKSILIYEPLLHGNDNQDGQLVTTIDELIKKSDVIIANRSDDLIKIAGKKLYTRDAFHTDK